jgi:hypothetical protein
MLLLIPTAIYWSDANPIASEMTPLKQEKIHSCHSLSEDMIPSGVVKNRRGRRVMVKEMFL